MINYSDIDDERTQRMRGFTTVTDAAERIGSNRQYVRALLAQGRLKGEKINPRLWMISERSLDRYLATRRPPGRPAKRRRKASP
ncbi:MAG: helix-turn-helix domain-containing protein [Chloroflexi bacterium]|nr:helix-turn-helix domain-containing protein [Chloroflexota bacterium]